MLFSINNKGGTIIAIRLTNLEIMILTERKIPKWKEREEKFKNQSFDSSLETLGTNGAFLNAKKIVKELKSPLQITSKEVCED